ncbi:hypothetical protein BH10PSE1_BH10PSE1_33700 [soil metagenome]
MSQYDPNLDPTRQPNTPRAEPIYSETIVVRRESNTGWWIAAGLAAVVLIAVIWILASRSAPAETDAEAQARLAEAQATQAVADAQARANDAVIQGQIAGGQQSVDIARADAVRAQAEAIRAASEARTAEVRAATPPAPVVITQPAPPPSTGTAVITSNAPQP